MHQPLPQPRLTTFRIATFLVLLATAFGVVTADAASTKTKQLRQRIKALPPAQAAAWIAYADRSDAWMARDRASVQEELARLGMQEETDPPYADEFDFDPHKSSDWYASDAGRAMANAILSYQIPCGGWSKHVDMRSEPRKPGQAYSPDGLRIATIDNDATTTQIQILARAYRATGDIRYRDATLRGIQYLLDAQYPNGGWPQYYPLQGAYHDMITYNDDAILHVMGVLEHVGRGDGPFAFVPDAVRAEARAAFGRGLDNILATCVRIDGVPVGWGQQHDMLTLKPTSARKFEPTGLCTAETGDLLDFLMQLDDPSPELVSVVHGVAKWLTQVEIEGKAWVSKDGNYTLVDNKDAGPLWARLYDLGEFRPIFGDRDGEVYYSVEEISPERRNGYHWYVTNPRKPLDRFGEWSTEHPLPQGDAETPEKAISVVDKRR